MFDLQNRQAELNGSFRRQLGGSGGINADELALAALVFKLNESLDQSEERVVLTAADIIAGFPFSAALASKDVATEDVLAAELL